MTSPERPSRRSLAVSVYLPTLLLAIGEGAVTPIIALMALDLGATPAVAGVMVAARSVGTMLFDIPAGNLVARYGERRIMLIATGVLCSAALLLGFGPPLPVYATLILLVGASTSVWSVARVLFLSDAVSPLHHGRAMSMLGGVDRIGIVVGASLGSYIVVPLGLPGPFLVQAGGVALAAVILATSRTLVRGERRVTTVRPSLRTVVREHRRTFATAGVVVGTMGLVRISRQAIIPLWGDSIGLTASEIAGIFAIASAIEIVSFYPVGLIMDRKGRKWTGLPFLLIVSLGLCLVPTATTYGQLLGVTLLIGLGNGFGAGIMMTLGSDLSPREGRSQVFGVWRLIGDTGGASGPLVVSLLTAVAGIASASVGVGLLGLVAAGVFAFVVPETHPSRRRSDP